MTRMVELMAWIAQSQGLSAAEIATHKDFSQQTVCPGKNLEPYVRSGWLHQAVDGTPEGAGLAGLVRLQSRRPTRKPHAIRCHRAP